MCPPEGSQGEKAAVREIEGSVPGQFRDPARANHLRQAVAQVLAGFEGGEPGSLLRFVGSRSKNGQSVIAQFGNLAPTWSLSERNHEVLRLGLMALVATSVGDDWRDTMISLASYHVVSEELGMDTAALFSEVGRSLAGPQRTLLEDFGRRRDITLEAFGLELRQTGEGPEIVWVG